MSAAVGSRKTCLARRRALPADRSCTTCRAMAMAVGFMLNSLRPNPTSSPRRAGSAANSPHKRHGNGLPTRSALHQMNEPQHRGVQRLVQIRYAIIGAVDGEAVLDEVVRPNRDEVDF